MTKYDNFSHNGLKVLKVHVTFLLVVNWSFFVSVIPAGSLQLGSGGADTLQTIAMSSAASSAGTIVHYNPGSEPQFIVPGEAQFQVDGKPCNRQKLISLI